jgi:hypothetical protein
MPRRPNLPATRQYPDAMTEEATQPRAAEPPLLVQRPGILVGLIGAVIALSALAVWPADYYVFARQAMMVTAGLLAVFALLGGANTGRRINLIWFGAALIVGGFWLFTYGDFGREVNMIADVVSAAVFLVVGFFTDRQTKFKVTGVVVLLLVGVAATAWGFSSQLAAQAEWEECIAYAKTYEEDEDPVEWCRMVLSPPDD